jgi:hypothetical protein
MPVAKNIMKANSATQSKLCLLLFNKMAREINPNKQPNQTLIIPSITKQSKRLKYVI